MKAFFIFFVLFFVIFITVVTAAPEYDVIANHPRIHLNDSDVADVVVAKCQIAPYQVQCNAMEEEAKDVYAGTDYSLDNVPLLAFVYLITDNSSYCDEVDETLFHYLNDVTFENAGYDKKRFAENITIYAIGYDWCYNAPLSHKTDFEDKLEDFAYECTKFNWSERIETHSRYHGMVERMYGCPAVGLALSDENVNDVLADDVMEMYEDFILYEIFPAADEYGADGGQFEGMEYGRWINGRLIEMMSMMEIGTNYTFSNEYSHLTNLSKFLLHSIRPDKTYFRKGDNKNPQLTHYYDITNPMYLASRYSDSYAQWLVDKINTDYPGDDYNSTPDAEKWRVILWYNDSIDKTDPDTLQLVKKFNDTTGEVFMRTGWDLSGVSTNIYANFKCGYYFDAHQHHDQASFVIARGNTSLAIDSGGYDYPLQSHVMNYYHRTIAHNNLLIYNPEEEFTYGIYDFSNDGGQRFLRTERENIGQPLMYGDVTNPENDGFRKDFQTCEMEGFEDNTGQGNYTYIKANVTNAYNSTKTDFMTREFVFVKSSSLFVVFDITNVTNTSFEKIWVMHTINEPTIDPVNNITTSVYNQSKITVKTLLPTNKTMASVGGLDPPYLNFSVRDENGDLKNFPFCEDQNGNPIDGCTPPKEPPNEPGTWRVEITANGSKSREYFLNALYVSSASETMDDSYLIEDHDYLMYGSLVGTDLVMFSKNGTVNITALYYNISALDDDTESHHIVTGLKPDEKYVVRSSTGMCRSMMSTSQGIINFYATGNITINQTNCYVLENFIIGYGQGSGSSANYEIIWTLLDYPVGIFKSINYILYMGWTYYFK